MTQQCNDLEDALIRESSRNGSYPFEVGVKDFDSKRESCMHDKLLLNETGIPAIWTAPSHKICANMGLFKGGTSKKRKIAKVRNCPDITIFNSLVGLCLCVYSSFYL